MSFIQGHNDLLRDFLEPSVEKAGTGTMSEKTLALSVYIVEGEYEIRQPNWLVSPSFSSVGMYRDNPSIYSFGQFPLYQDTLFRSKADLSKKNSRISAWL